MRHHDHPTRRSVRGSARPDRSATPPSPGTQPTGRRRHGVRDPQKFDEAYRALFPTIFRVAYRISGDSGLAEDLAHEAFVQLLRRDGELPSLSDTKYWLLRVVRNLSLNLQQRRGRERQAYVRARELSPGFAPGADEPTLAQEQRSQVQQALDALPRQMRSILVMREYGGLSYREIAGVMRISEGNVKVRLHRARACMARLLQEKAAR